MKLAGDLKNGTPASGVPFFYLLAARFFALAFEN